VGNWTWRLSEDELAPAVAERMANYSALYGRAPAAPHESPLRAVT
jgi:4-alpha-glucanotransferase